MTSKKMAIAKEVYVSPVVTVCEVSVEKGFAVSGAPAATESWTMGINL